MQTVEWPTENDLIEWIGGSSSDELAHHARAIMADAIDDALARIPTAALADECRPGGDNEGCPPRLRRALIMEAGRVYSRKSSQLGFARLNAEQTARIGSVDPDVTRYMTTLTNWPEA